MIRKLLAIIICLVLVFTCTAPAFADKAQNEQTEEISLEDIVQEIEQSAATARRNFYFSGLFIVAIGLVVIYVLPAIKREKNRRRK